MSRAGAVKHRVISKDELLFVRPDEFARQRSVSYLPNNALAEPLPELLLRSPETFQIPTEHESVFFRAPAILLVGRVVFRHHNG